MPWIDFFGLSARASGFPIEFVYPSVTSIVPANIGLIANAKNPELAKKFIAFALSADGQQLLFDPKISRLPVLPAMYDKAPAGYPNPFGGKITAKVKFDSGLSQSRYCDDRAVVPGLAQTYQPARRQPRPL